MPELLWDASALVKRYAVEAGSDTVAALFALIPPSSMVATFWSYVETFASLLRKHNRGEISAATWQSSATLLRLETLSSPDFRARVARERRSAPVSRAPPAGPLALGSGDGPILRTPPLTPA